MSVMEKAIPLASQPWELDGPRGERLAHLGRLCTAGQLAAGLAHELQQPLCSIAVYAEACLRLLDGPEVERSVLHEALGDVRREAMRAAAVIQQLRRFVRGQAPAARPVPIGEIVDRALALTDYETRHQGVCTRVRLDAALPPVLVEPVQIEQVLHNLVRNALDSIAAHRPPSPELVIDARLRDGAWVEVDVYNTGGPVPERIREQMFQPFFSTKPDRLGVGLYLARAILSAHQGSIECSSDLKGTTFRFTLPVAATDRSPKPAL